MCERVLVFWCGYRVGPWLVRSLSAARKTVFPAHPQGQLGGRSTAAPRPLRYPVPTPDPGPCLEWLEAVCRREKIDVVLPLDEDLVRIIAELSPDLGAAVVAGPNGRQYRMLCDKMELGRTAQQVGVDHPPSVEVKSGSLLGTWPALPSIVKPRISLTDGARAPVVAVTTESQREAAIAKLNEASLDAVVEKQIFGQPWVLHCVRDGNGGLGMVAARVETTYPRVVGTSSVSHVVPTPSALESAARRLLDVTDYRGPCCMNLIEREGKYYFHDINLRFAASAGAAVAAGFDQPRLAVEAAVGAMNLPTGQRMRRITYVPVQNEYPALRDALADASFGTASQIAGRLVRAALSRDHQLDPPVSDPLWLLDPLARAYKAIRRPAAGRRPGNA